MPRNFESTRITFAGALGHKLAARLDMPAGPPRAYALFAHCFTCSKDLHAVTRIAAGLNATGYAVLRFDFTGLGSSQGEFANTDFSSNIGDLVAAADWLREAHAAPSLLIGHSLGGAAVLAAATQIEEVKAVATIAAPADPEHVVQAFGGAVEDIRRDGEAEVSLVGRRFRIRRAFLADLADQDQQEAIRQLRCAVMVMHAPGDEVVGVDNARRIFEAARHPKSFVSLDTADHLLTRRADAAYVANVLAAWAERYVTDAAEDEKAPEEKGASAAGVFVRENGQGRLQQDVAVGHHRFVADEPRSLGGEDGGPSPYDLLAAALGACTTMTIRLYADRKELPLEHVAVRVTHDKIHAKDCADCESTDAMVDRFERHITIQGALDAAQTERVLAISKRCPVHRTLKGAVTIVDSADT